jgi:hypothetical protein
MADQELVAAHLGILRNSLSPEQQAASIEARMDPLDPTIPLAVWTNRLSTQMAVLSLTMLGVRIQLAKSPAEFLVIANDLKR